ncbi:FixJ family two-component response regulator [Acidovorax sp. 107]|uniref:response regulator transcription factor n=1 Tax=Acidovorax sp. 107 TaxID=2135638 RepID=UPI000D38DFDD|nr:response regulator [Acidovorax sp. 107]PUA95735.1 FixJ family two-component response regulator [Acidovorax sp. 107]
MTYDTLPTAAESPDDTVVYIVDDDEGVRQSLATLLLARGYTVRSFKGGEAFLAQAALDQSGCVLLDLRMEGLSGLQVFHELGQRHSALKTVFLSAHGELSSAVAAVKQGAVDWLEKPCNEATLLAAVEKASTLSKAQAQQAQRQHLLRERWSALSPRQQEVAQLLGTGLSSKEVARALAQRDPERPIDPRTVDTHRSAIFLKLDIRSSHELGMLVEDLGVTLGAPRSA